MAMKLPRSDTRLSFLVGTEVSLGTHLAKTVAWDSSRSLH